MSSASVPSGRRTDALLLLVAVVGVPAVWFGLRLTVGPGPGSLWAPLTVYALFEGTLCILFLFEVGAFFILVTPY